jgi:RNase adapter protein RapZ
MTEPDSQPQTRPVVIVTGPSGAGRSTAINALEDFGFEAIDNLPLTLVSRLLDGRPLERPLVLGVDTRNRDFSLATFGEVREWLTGQPAYDTVLLYLDSRPEVLLRRFSETRRRHPFSPDGSPEAGIERELTLIALLKEQADLLIDTSDLAPQDLRHALRRALDPGEGAGLTVSVQSFSYKRGLPQELDSVLDVRFLSNPHWIPDLRPLDGRDARIIEHVEADPRYAPFLDRTTALVTSLLPAYLAEGKTHFALGFGCTGGKHRSVAVAERVAKGLAEAGWRVSIRHRELERLTGAPRVELGSSA